MPRAIVADDNAAMRLILRRAISAVPECEAVGEAENGLQLVKMVKEIMPEVVFVDIVMPLIDGVSAAKEIADLNKNVFIVFVTAHDRYASDALAVHAFDYLTKPFNIECIRRTLERIKAIKANKIASAATDKSENAVTNTQRLLIKKRDSNHFINRDDIILITRVQRRTIIYVGAGSVSTRAA